MPVAAFTMLLQSSSSCKQYRDVIDELKALHRVLLLANDAISQHHDSDLPLSQSLVDSVKTEVCDCHLIMRSFLDNICRYRKPLSTTGIKGLWGQVWWAIWEQDELEGLRKSIATRVQRIHVMLSSFNAVAIRDGNLNVKKLVARLSTPNPLFHDMDDMTWVVDIGILVQRLEIDPNNGDDWHQMGRTYMVGQNYSKAYEAYQQAVYRDGKNPIYWCDVGRLYAKLYQWSDAVDAYSRGIRVNPYISEIWACLGQSYYEGGSPENLHDSLAAYSRALELDPTNQVAGTRVGS
ncbi:hypothetical protein BDZ97DRAFT_987992 [Flammula alnicola]|nr:hypothetical protein BDZ97DRAFT_987992 [Flammula alnicola]